nr:hypothetical protein Iba_chr04eCG16030 [Ipomoea batatas]
MLVPLRVPVSPLLHIQVQIGSSQQGTRRMENHEFSTSTIDHGRAGKLSEQGFAANEAFEKLEKLEKELTLKFTERGRGRLGRFVALKKTRLFRERRRIDRCQKQTKSGWETGSVFGEKFIRMFSSDWRKQSLPQTLCQYIYLRINDSCFAKEVAFLGWDSKRPELGGYILAIIASVLVS